MKNNTLHFSQVCYSKINDLFWNYINWKYRTEKPREGTLTELIVSDSCQWVYRCKKVKFSSGIWGGSAVKVKWAAWNGDWIIKWWFFQLQSFLIIFRTFLSLVKRKLHAFWLFHLRSHPESWAAETQSDMQICRPALEQKWTIQHSKLWKKCRQCFNKMKDCPKVHGGG